LTDRETVATRSKFLLWIKYLFPICKATQFIYMNTCVTFSLSNLQAFWTALDVSVVAITRYGYTT
jgi:uncharacterized membrane protein YfhO